MAYHYRTHEQQHCFDSLLKDMIEYFRTTMFVLRMLGPIRLESLAKTRLMYSLAQKWEKGLPLFVLTELTSLGFFLLSFWLQS